MTVLLGLAVALLWGSADTLALFATRRIGSGTTTLVAQLSGLFLVALVGLTFAGPLNLLTISASSLILSILVGIVLGGVSAGAFLSLYKSLNHGPLAVVSPVVSAQGGVTLLLAVVLLQEHLAGLQLLFLLLTFVGVLPLAVGVFVLKERLTLSQLLGCVLLGMALVGSAAPGPELALALAGLAVALVVGCGLALLRDIVTAKSVRVWPISLPSKPLVVPTPSSTGPLGSA